MQLHYCTALLVAGAHLGHAYRQQHGMLLQIYNEIGCCSISSGFASAFRTWQQYCSLI
jgi:hypothetical protein